LKTSAKRVLDCLIAGQNVSKYVIKTQKNSILFFGGGGCPLPVERGKPVPTPNPLGDYRQRLDLVENFQIGENNARLARGLSPAKSGDDTYLYITLAKR